MKITIMTLGSRGDVQPYVALAQELLTHGHHPTLCTGVSFKPFIESYGIAFAPASLDLMAILRTPQGAAIMRGDLRALSKALSYIKKVINPAFRASLDDFWHAAQGADLIIYHPKVTAAVDIASALHVPCLSMPPVPVTYPITEFPNLALAPTSNWGAFFNKLSYKMLAKADLANMQAINDFRQNTLKLPKRKAGAFTRKNGDKLIPILYPISPALFKDVKSWQNDVFVSGFFFLPPPTKELAPDLLTFINAGEKPIVISFSSMPLKNPALFAQKLIAALTITGNRAIILSGVSGLNLPAHPHFFITPQAPHALLFPLVKGIVHHGGAGTTAMALCSGVPQLIIPFAMDQPFWAHRLHQQGYALPPLKERTLSSAQLVVAFKEMANPKHITKAQEIKQIILSENGLQKAVVYIENLVPPPKV